MKFCTSCGAPLEFFEFLDGELCSSCLEQSKKESLPSRSPEKQSFDLQELSDIILGVENEKIVIKSAEGVVLWSGPAQKTHKVQTILSRTLRIVKIRNKRNKQSI